MVGPISQGTKIWLMGDKEHFWQIFYEFIFGMHVFVKIFLENRKNLLEHSAQRVWEVAPIFLGGETRF